MAARTYNASGAPLYAETTPRDERGRIDYKDTTAGRLDYDYYANGLLKDVVSSNPDGVNLGYRYDELNRLAYVDDATNGIPPRTHAYTYNANGSLESVTYANGLSHVYTYDALNRLRGLQVGAVVPDGPGLSPSSTLTTASSAPAAIVAKSARVRKPPPTPTTTSTASPARRSRTIPTATAAR